MRFEVGERRTVSQSVAELDGELWRTGQDPIGSPTLRLRLLASKTLQSIQRGKTTRVEVAKQSRAWPQLSCRRKAQFGDRGIKKKEERKRSSKRRKRRERKDGANEVKRNEQ